MIKYKIKINNKTINNRKRLNKIKNTINKIKNRINKIKMKLRNFHHK